MVKKTKQFQRNVDFLRHSDNDIFSSKLFDTVKVRGKIKVKLSLCLINRHPVKTYAKHKIKCWIQCYVLCDPPS